MRFAWLITMSLLLVAAPAAAQIGPPQPRAAPFDYTLGVGLHNLQNEWNPYDYTVSRNRVYLEGSFGLSENLEVFGRVGGSDWTINDVNTYEEDLEKDVSSHGYPAFGSLGIRGRGWQAGPWSLGASLEVAWYNALETNLRWDYDVYQELYFDSTLEFNIGITLGYELGCSIVYGGPLFHFAYTRADVRTHEFGMDWDVEDDIDELTVRDKAGVGAFLGWRTPIGEYGWNLQLEGSALPGGFGGAVGFYKTR